MRKYLQLVRLPNLFTAMADVTMGFLFTHAAFGRGDAWVFALLLAASSWPKSASSDWRIFSWVAAEVGARFFVSYRECSPARLGSVVSRGLR